MLRGIGTNTLRQRDRHRAVIFERDEVMVAKEASVHADDFLKGFAGTRPESGLWSVIKVPRWHYSAGVTVRSRTRALPPRPRQQERGIPVETYVGSRSSCFREPDCPGGDCLMPDGQTAGSHHFPTTTPSSPPQRAQRPNSCTACDNSAISDEVAEALRQFIEALSTSPRRTHDPDALLTAEELGEILRIPARTVKDQAAAGVLPHRRFGKHYRFSRDDLQEIVRRAGHTPAPAPRSRRAP